MNTLLFVLSQKSVITGLAVDNYCCNGRTNGDGQSNLQRSLCILTHVHSCENKEDREVDTDGAVEGLLPEVVGRVADNVGKDCRYGCGNDEAFGKIIWL